MCLNLLKYTIVKLYNMLRWQKLLNVLSRKDFDLQKGNIKIYSTIEVICCLSDVVKTDKGHTDSIEF